jgi:hypothetical protein
MARLRLRLQLNKGRLGAPLSKLGRISEQAERFLRALATEVQINNPGEWLAVNFANGSVSYDAEYQGDVSQAQAAIFSRHLEYVVDYDPDAEGAQGMVQPGTLAEYARIGALIDPDEVVGIGIYRDEKTKPIWRQISYAKTARIRRAVEAPLPTYGAVQGIIHSLQKEARQPYFQVRELATDVLVRCTYTVAHGRDQDTWYIKQLLQAARDGEIVAFTSTLSIAECTTADGQVTDQVKTPSLDCLHPGSMSCWCSQRLLLWRMPEICDGYTTCPSVAPMPCILPPPWTENAQNSSPQTRE